MLAVPIASGTPASEYGAVVERRTQTLYVPVADVGKSTRNSTTAADVDSVVTVEDANAVGKVHAVVETTNALASAERFGIEQPICLRRERHVQRKEGEESRTQLP